MNIQELADKWGVSYQCTWHRIKISKIKIKNRDFRDIDNDYNIYRKKGFFSWTTKRTTNGYLFESSRSKKQVYVIGDDIDEIIRQMALVVSAYYRNKLKEVK